VAAATAFKVNVAATIPGIITVGPSEQGAILNIKTSVTPNDYSVNSTKNTAAPGSWMTIYATGFRVTTCTSVQGSTCDSSAPKSQFGGGGVVTPAGTLAVTIGGQAVASPVAVVPDGSVIGLLQIKAQAPASVTPGNAVPVVVSVGGVSSAGVATMAVKSPSASFGARLHATRGVPSLSKHFSRQFL
jgi:uncharacterized protein (TIGR03437 family)